MTIGGIKMSSDLRDINLNIDWQAFQQRHPAIAEEMIAETRMRERISLESIDPVLQDSAELIRLHELV